MNASSNRGRLSQWAATCLILMAGVFGQADAAVVRADHVEAELVAAQDAWTPGQTVRVALRLKHEPHWHTYWQVPGDSGLPTRVEWSSDAGLTGGPLQWPAPQRLPSGPLVNYGYEGEVLLMSDVQVPTNVVPGTQPTLTAKAEWLVCKDQCIPGSATLSLQLPVASAAKPARPSQWASLFDVMLAAVPTTQPAALVSARREGTSMRLELSNARPYTSLAFFPLEDSRIEASAPQTLGREGNAATLSLTAAQPMAADFTQLRGVIVADGGANQGGWAAIVSTPIALAGPAGAGRTSGAGKTVTAEAAANPAQASMTVWLALLGAFIGGLVLNLMPCVFPVLSLKLIGLVQHNKPGHAGASLPAHGVAFSIGAILSFVALAALLITLQATGAQLGWGFQLQTPVVVAALIALFFAIGLNLLGTYEVTMLTGVANSSVAQNIDTGNGLKGSFGTGVLAVVVASPCTAPFMGAALGYAVTQPWPVALSVFGMLGVGMATPYMLLTLFPPLLRRLPRPGVWMERFKQIMAFPMFVTCVWLMWVLMQQVDANAFAIFLFGLVALGMAAWALGLAQHGSPRYRWVALTALAASIWTVSTLVGASVDPVGGSAAVPAGGPAKGAPVSKSGSSQQWAAWSPTAVQAQLSAGKPVFVDFTAAWCVTCQANKKLVLHRAVVEQAFKNAGVTLMKADWTNRDATITQELARYGRNGVPLYVLYDRSGKATVLPEILSNEDVLGALAQLSTGS